MANKSVRLPQNVPGPFYVDESCIDCDMCRESAPQFFKRDDENAVSFAYRQPVTAPELALAEEAKQSCPSDSIGNDGRGV